MKITKLLIVFMVSLPSAMMLNCSDQILTPAQQRQDIIDVAMAPENYVDLKQDLAFLESQNLLKPHLFLNLLEENVTESQDANFDEVIEKAHDLITEQMKDPFISTLQRALEENKPLADYATTPFGAIIFTYFGAIQIPIFTYVMQRKDSDMTLQNIVLGWLLAWSTTKNSKGATPLHLAAENGHIEILQMLITAGANVNSQMTDGGITPLHFAADNGHTEIVQLLIDAGANVNIQTTGIGATSLHIAAGDGHTEIVQLLIDAGANVNIQTTDIGATSLHIAALIGYTETVRLLIDVGANVNIQTTDYEFTPLHIAAQRSHTEIVKLLIAAGADITLRIYDGRVAEDLARTNQIRNIFRRARQGNNQSEVGYCSIS